MPKNSSFNLNSKSQLTDCKKNPATCRFRLAFAELEATTSALLPVLLALFHARIARQKTIFSQPWPQLRVEHRQRARKSHAHRAGLTAHTAALRGRFHVELLHSLGEFQRLDRRGQPRHILEIFFHGAAVHRELARAHFDIHARDRLAAPARAEKLLPCTLIRIWRRSQKSLRKSSSGSVQPLRSLVFEFLRRLSRVTRKLFLADITPQ